jgi:hypothetical protein
LFHVRGRSAELLPGRSSTVELQYFEEIRLKVWPTLGVATIQTLLFLAHWFIYHTWVVFLPMSEPAQLALLLALAILSVSLITGTLLSFRFSNWLVSTIYKIGAVWLCWIVDFTLRLAHVGLEDDRRPWIAMVLGSLALVAVIYGLLNARWIRERRVTVTLPGLPASWRGRTALLVSDLHLGNINGARFSRRIAAIARRLNPAIIFIAGDLFDGSKADPDRLAAPLFSLSPPFGIYFCGGNHEDFGDADEYASALARGGIRVLHNESVTVDGLQVLGVSYADSTYPLRFRTFLESVNLGAGTASVLLNHVPNRLPLVEQAGVSLQLSGHTHGGQMFPFTWITRRAFGKFTYGLQRFGKLQIYTSSGAGTWGPPMRVGTHPEVVSITFALAEEEYFDFEPPRLGDEAPRPADLA